MRLGSRCLSALPPPMHRNHHFCGKSHSEFQLLLVPNSVLSRKEALIECCVTKRCPKGLLGAALDLGLPSAFKPFCRASHAREHFWVHQHQQ